MTDKTAPNAVEIAAELIKQLAAKKNSPEFHLGNSPLWPFREVIATAHRKEKLKFTEIAEVLSQAMQKSGGKGGVTAAQVSMFLRQYDPASAKKRTRRPDEA